MKFEKHLKNTGIYGVIFAASNGDKYLRTGKDGNVLARIPAGFAPIGAPEVCPMESWIDDLLIKGADDLPEAELFKAKLEKDGRAKDIIRVWSDGHTEYAHRRCEIDNAAFGLIERSDVVKIFDPQIDLGMDDIESIDEEPTEPEEFEFIRPALVILDRDESVVGIVIDCRWDE